MRFPDKYIYIIFFLLGNFIYAQSEFKIPDPTATIYPVNDYTSTLTYQQVQSLNSKLINYSDSTSTEIVVALVSTLDGDDINYVAARWGEKWGIGQKDKNNGILLLIAVQDRKLAIQTGRGTEDAMTDMMSGIIINQYMVPYLKQNNFYGAIETGTDKIIEVLQGKFQGLDKKNTEDNEPFSELFIAIIVIIFIMLFLTTAFGKKNKDTYYDRKGKRRKDDDDFLGGGFGGFGGGFGGFGGGSSGGGFGGFGGGGSFGGGGASGSW